MSLPLDRLEVSLPTSWGVATYPPGATFGPRLMRDYELVWMIEGDAEYQWETQRVSAPQGSIVLCRPGAQDFFRWDPLHRTRHGFFHFQIERMPPGLPALEVWPFVQNPPEGDILRPLFRYLLTGMGKGPTLPHQIAITQMVAAFITGDLAGDDPRGGAWPDAVERAWKSIQTTLDEDASRSITLASLAKDACVTREHLCRLFHDATGYSPMDTVRRARLDRAAVLLARSNYSIGEIAALSGFPDPFLFARRFKIAFGQTPTQMRHSVRAGGPPPPPLLARVHQFYPGF